MKRNANITKDQYVKLRTKMNKGTAQDIALAKVTRNEHDGLGVKIVGDTSKRALCFIKWADIETLKVRRESRVMA